jgi:Flp pilus assembly protein TadG
MRANRYRGAATVEFALVLVILLLLLFGMLEIGRALFKWNSAAEATRIGARTAAIVAVNDKAKVLAAMQPMMPELTADNVTLQYSTDGTSFGASCTPGTCMLVRVGVSYTYHPVLILFDPALSLLPESIRMPTLATTYTVEALGAT